MNCLNYPQGSVWFCNDTPTYEFSGMLGGIRPVLILSASEFNEGSSYVLVAMMTHNVRRTGLMGSVFVNEGSRSSLTGTVYCDQIHFIKKASLTKFVYIMHPKLFLETQRRCGLVLGEHFEKEHLATEMIAKILEICDLSKSKIPKAVYAELVRRVEADIQSWICPELSDTHWSNGPDTEIYNVHRSTDIAGPKIVKNSAMQSQMPERQKVLFSTDKIAQGNHAIRVVDSEVNLKETSTVLEPQPAQPPVAEVKESQSVQLPTPEVKKPIKDSNPKGKATNKTTIIHPPVRKPTQTIKQIIAARAAEEATAKPTVAKIIEEAPTTVSKPAVDLVVHAAKTADAPSVYTVVEFAETICTESLNIVDSRLFEWTVRAIVSQLHKFNGNENFDESALTVLKELAEDPLFNNSLVLAAIIRCTARLHDLKLYRKYSTSMHNCCTKAFFLGWLKFIQKTKIDPTEFVLKMQVAVQDAEAIREGLTKKEIVIPSSHSETFFDIPHLLAFGIDNTAGEITEAELSKRWNGTSKQLSKLANRVSHYVETSCVEGIEEFLSVWWQSKMKGVAVA